ncbi:MAG: VanW family protein [Clostridiales bacterium]|jgi:vancomycin resistance protein YoaR|nr:VanW family protein [Clostridiales bacterium]
MPEVNVEKINFNRKFFLALAFSLIFLFHCSMSAFSNLGNNDKIAENVYVLGQCVGDLSEEEAISVIKKKYANSLSGRKILVFFEGKTNCLDLDNIDAKINFEETISNVLSYRKKRNFFTFIFEYFKPKAEKKIFPLVISYNENFMCEFLNSILADKENDPTEWSYKVQDEDLIIISGKSGLKSNKKEVFENIKTKITYLNFEDEKILLEEVEPRPLDIEKLYEEMNSEPKDAYYEKLKGKVVIIPDKKRIHVSKEELENLLVEKQDVYRTKIMYESANVTEGMLEKKLFKDRLSTYTTMFNVSNINRSINIKISSDKCNGYEMLPDEIFSFNKSVGARTVENGFKISRVFVGVCATNGIGGGICQTSSTMYSSAIYANLEVIERMNHSLPVSYVPLGQDATIAQRHIDLKIRNSTSYPIKIVSEVGSGKVTFSFWGTNEDDYDIEIKHTTKKVIPYKTFQEEDSSIAEGQVKIKQNGMNGCEVSSQRIIKKDGKIIKIEELPESLYSPIDKVEFINPKKQQENQVFPSQFKKSDKQSKNTQPEFKIDNSLNVEEKISDNLKSEKNNEREAKEEIKEEVKEEFCKTKEEENNLELFDNGELETKIESMVGEEVTESNVE